MFLRFDTFISISKIEQIYLDVNFIQKFKIKNKIHIKIIKRLFLESFFFMKKNVYIKYIVFKQ